MASLLPKQRLDDIAHGSERKVAEALCAQLPPDCKVFHSYPWLRYNRDAINSGSQLAMREGEADFVIVHPRFGLMVLEIKGGNVSYDPATLKWQRHAKPIKNPFEQASRNQHFITGTIKERAFPLAEKVPFVHGHAVVFPDCNTAGSLPPGADSSCLWTAKDLSALGTKVEALFSKWDWRANSARLADGILDGIVRGLTSTFQLTPALWREVEDQENTLIQLTEEQAKILEVLCEHPRAAIKGCAGSGKTRLAMTRARRFAEEGKKTLFLCYNRLLEEWLEAEQPPETKSHLLIRTFHGLCSDFCKEASKHGAGLSFPVANALDASFWIHDAPALLEEALDHTPTRFDAIVVDEGQDFADDWWLPVELLLRDPDHGPMYVFFDPDQQVFGLQGRAMPNLGNPFRLLHNCRNTTKIASCCSSVLGMPMKSWDRAPEGRAVAFKEAPTDKEQIDSTKVILASWLTGNGGLKPRQVAIVTAGSTNKGPFANLSEIGGFPLTEKLETWKKGGEILLTSAGRFKGLEADAVLLVDVPELANKDCGQGFGTNHLYVACSRAKHLLAIIARHSAVEKCLLGREHQSNP